MNWELHRNNLKEGKQVQITPKGNSMLPIIESGNTLTIVPCNKYKKDDIVFCKVKGNYYIHKITAVKQDSYQISNNKGRVNGWTKNIFGKVIKIERKKT